MFRDVYKSVYNKVESELCWVPSIKLLNKFKIEEL